MESKRPRGRPSRYAKYEQLLASLPHSMTKRPLYVDQIGLFRGARGVTVWIKVRHPDRKSSEIKLGSLTSWSWEQLEQKRSELQGRADRDEPLRPKKVATFAEYADGWLQRKRHTAKGYGTLKGHVSKHLLPTFGKTSLSDISTTAVNGWLGQQRATLKPSTVKRQLNTLNAILNDALKAGVIEKNPAALSDSVRGIEPRTRFLSDADLKKIFAVIDKIEKEERTDREMKPCQKIGWLRSFVMWAIQSGMRRQEILNLNFSDITIMDDETWVFSINNTKSGHPRQILCNDTMKGIIGSMRLMPREKGDQRIFPVSLTTAKRKLTNLWKICGLEDVRLHDMRRTHASVLVKNGVDIRTVAARLGHRDTKMLMAVYAVQNNDAYATKLAQATFSNL